MRTMKICHPMWLCSVHGVHTVQSRGIIKTFLSLLMRENIKQSGGRSSDCVYANAKQEKIAAWDGVM